MGVGWMRRNWMSYSDLISKKSPFVLAFTGRNAFLARCVESAVGCSDCNASAPFGESRNESGQGFLDRRKNVQGCYNRASADCWLWS